MESEKQMDIKDIFSIQRPTDVQISPSGKIFSYCRTTLETKDNREQYRTSIWIHETDRGLTHCITPQNMSAHMPRWSDDDNYLFFIGKSTDDDFPQLYRFNLENNLLYRLSNVSGELKSFETFKSGSKTALLIDDPRQPEQDPIEYEGNASYSRIWVLEIDTGLFSCVTKDCNVWEFSISPDGKHIAALISEEPFEREWYIAKIFLIDLKTFERKLVYSSAPRQVAIIKWSNDCKKLYFISAVWSDRGLIGGDLFFIDSLFDPDIKITNLSNSSLGSISYYAPQDDDILVLSVNNEEAQFSRIKIAQNKIDVLSRKKEVISPPYQPRFSISKSEDIAYIAEDADHPPEVRTSKIQGQSLVSNKETNLNGNVSEKIRGKLDFISWRSFDGLEIHGFMVHPETNWKNRPMIVDVHGGPSTGYGYGFNPVAKFFVSKGFNVFLPNPRGSMGRGNSFLELNRGNVEGDDFKDVLAGIDFCINHGYADKDRLFIMGGSYGGYLTAWAITQTDIFKGAVVNYGISDFMSCHGTQWNTYWDEFVFDINPFENPEVYYKKSPMTYIKNVKTPTLILHGQNDPCVHISQAVELYTFLKELKVETKFYIYPREKHGWIERKHVSDAILRQTDWFIKHMG